MGSQCPENLSDHVEVVLRMDSYPTSDVDSSSAERKTCPSQSNNNKSKIRLDKCDLQLYSNILQTSLQRIEDKHSSTLLDIDLTAVALNKILNDASAVSTPNKRKSGVQKKNRLPVWNEKIEADIQLSEGAHKDWRDAGCPRYTASPLLIQKKTARRLMRQTVRQQSYLQMQDKYIELMLAKEMDTRIFYKLVNQQRSARNTATELLNFDGQAFSTAEGIASPFSSHFKNLATPTDSDVFDKNYTNQVTFDKLLMQSLAADQPRCEKPVSPKRSSTLFDL